MGDVRRVARCEGWLNELTSLAADVDLVSSRFRAPYRRLRRDLLGCDEDTELLEEGSLEVVLICDGGGEEVVVASFGSGIDAGTRGGRT